MQNVLGENHFFKSKAKCVDALYVYMPLDAFADRINYYDLWIDDRKEPPNPWIEITGILDRVARQT